MPIVRSTLRHCGVCSKGQSERVSACASSAWDGVLLQPRPGACGEHVIQRPGVLRLPGGTWHGIPRIQEGGHLKYFCSHISLTYDFDSLFA